ncbi:MAG: hypothetical protein ABS75_22700 [Pelagibacterium sp. SCN 63-23]|nr:MAG: hypothetical protein ABS75_22700 [Pelagibacterium sp. SCN 63-23]
MPFSYLALLPKRYRHFFFNWIFTATVIRAAIGIAETKGVVSFPSYGGEAILAATFVFAFILLVKTPSQSNDD